MLSDNKRLWLKLLENLRHKFRTEDIKYTTLYINTLDILISKNPKKT